MGMNYYHRTNCCSKCKRYDSRHIGKSSCGWTFTFRGYPDSTGQEDGIIIESYKDWLKVLKKGQIFSEEEELVTLQKFMTLVNTKTMAKNNHAEQFYSSSYPRNWTDYEGHSFSEGEFS